MEIKSSKIDIMARKVKSVKSVKVDAPAVVSTITDNPAITSIVNTLYSQLVPQVSDIIANGVSVSNIVTIIDATMQLVGQLQTLTGVEKKAVVITLVNKIIASSNVTPEEAAVITMLIDPLIDQIYAIAPDLYGKIKAKCLTFPCCRKN
jgi:hypothetical protein